jgi:lipopolysaccharide export system permease protein
VSLLDRYLARAVISGSLMVLLVLAALSAFVGFVGQFGQIGTGSYEIGDAAIHVLLSLPSQAYDMMPVAVLIGSLISLGALATQNELTVMRASGIPVWRIAAGAMAGAVLLAVAGAAMGEYIAAPAERYADQSRAMKLHDQVNLLGRGGVWLRDGRTYVNARHSPEAGRLEGLFLYRFDDQGRLREVVRARGADHAGGEWQLLGAETLRLGDDRLERGREREMNWETGIDPQLLAVVGVKPDSLSATGLWSYIAYLEGNELDADRYRIAFWFKLVVPVAMVIMALLAVPFLFGQLRSTGAGQRLMIGLLVGIVFYLINITLANTGAMFGLPPAVVAWTPTTLLAIAAFWAVRRI